jgi:hypothetical protein
VVGVEYILRKIPNIYLYKNQYLSNNSHNIEILILGSSHSFFGINPNYFSRRAFNAAHVSQSFNYDYFIFDKYKDKMTNLKTIILPISYFSLFTTLEDGIEHWRVKYYAIYYDCEYHHELKYHYEIINQKPAAVLKKIYSYQKGAINIDANELGFGLRYTTDRQSNLIASGLRAAKRHTAKNFDFLELNMRFLKKLVAESETRGVAVFLFTPPARNSYIANLNKNQLSLMKSSIVNIVKNNPHVEYYDFMRDDRFINDDFKDADHLNGIGAKKLTQLIDRLIMTKCIGGRP